MHRPRRLQQHCNKQASPWCAATPQVQNGVPVLRVRKGIQTIAFLGPVLALTVLSNPAISPPLALLCMTAALGITSLGEPPWAVPQMAGQCEQAPKRCMHGCAGCLPLLRTRWPLFDRVWWGGG